MCDPCGYKGTWKKRKSDASGALLAHETSVKHRRVMGSRAVRLPA